MMRIMAIEKNEEALAFLENQIKSAFPESVCNGFADPLMAIQFYTRSPSDLTIFCLDMKIIDGFTFTRTMRNIERTFTGIVLAEDSSQLNDIRKYQLEGVVKPYGMQQLKDAWEVISALQ